MQVFFQLPFFISLLFVGHFSGPLELSATGNYINAYFSLLLFFFVILLCFCMFFLMLSLPPIYIHREALGNSVSNISVL